MTAKTSAQRAREYRARLREGRPPKKPAKTNAERAREHRARMRAMKPPKKPPKTNAERAREHRARLRALKLQVPITEPSKMTADRARDCRAQMRACMPTKKEPKSQVQRNREWRERKKRLQDQKLDLSLLLTNSDPSASNPVVSDKTETLLRICKVPRSLLEYNRGWRERKKQLHVSMQQDQHLDFSMPSTSTTSFASNLPVTDKIKAQLQEHKAPKSQLEHNGELEEQDHQLNLSISSTNSASSTSTNNCSSVNDETEVQPAFNSHQNMHHEFKGKFLKNNRGSMCYVCRRVLFSNEMNTPIQAKDAPLLHAAFPDHNVNPIIVCNSCRSILKNCTIPAFSKSNGFVNPEMLSKEIANSTRSDGSTNLVTTQQSEKPIITIQPMTLSSVASRSNATDNVEPSKEMTISTRNNGPLNLAKKSEKPVITIQPIAMDNESDATVVSSTMTTSDNEPQRTTDARNDGPINLIMRSDKRIIRIQSIKVGNKPERVNTVVTTTDNVRTPSLNITTNQVNQEKTNKEIIAQRQTEAKFALFKQLEKTILEMARSKPSKASSTNVTTNRIKNNQEKNNTEMITQSTTELALGKHLEKALLQMPRPTLLAPDLHFLPDVNSPQFAYYLGLDVVVDFLGKDNSSSPHSVEPIVCSECKTDFAATWRTIKKKRSGQEQNSICNTCFSVTTKRSLKEEHNSRLKDVLVKALQQEKETEQSSVSNVPLPQMCPQSSRSLLKPVSHHLH